MRHDRAVPSADSAVIRHSPRSPAWACQGARARAVAVALLGAATLLVPSRARAQDTTARGAREVTVRVAEITGARSCPCKASGLAVPQGRGLYMVAIGARWRIAGSERGRASLEYVGELLPAIVSRGTADDDLTFKPCGLGLCGTLRSPDPWHMQAAGAGFLPVGFAGRVRVAPGIQVELRAAGGMAVLSRPVPLAQAGRFNFIAEVSPTAEVRMTHRVAATVGLVLNHISNGGTAELNPGMNSRMLELGVAYRR